MMCKKILQICFVCLLPLLLASCSTMKPTLDEYIPSAEQLDVLLDRQLGGVAPFVTSQEREELLRLLEEKTALKAQRIAKKEPQPSEKEEDLTLELNMLYNQYTAYYLMEGADVEDVDYQEEMVPLKDYQNTVLNNLKEVLSARDYLRIKKYAQEMQGDPYKMGESYDKINEILWNYPELDADSLTYYIFYSDETTTLARFEIDADYNMHYIPIQYVTDLRLNPRDAEEYQELWDFICTVLPSGGMDQFALLTFASDGEYDLLAAVAPIDIMGSVWELEVDPADAVHKGAFTLTVLHEYTHYITLNNRQVRYTPRTAVEVYGEDGMISKDNSYINLFYQAFWTDLLDDRIVNRRSYLFATRHFDEFVSFYAASNPSEDISESFCAFLLLDKPDGDSIWEQKVRFFYDFPELVKMRMEIRRDLEKEGLTEEIYDALADEFAHIPRRPSESSSSGQKVFGGR